MPTRVFDLSVITVSHGHERFLADCVQSLSEAISGLSAELILVDNLGTGQLPSAIGKTKLSVSFQTNRTPQGFARNTNQAVQKSSGHHLLFLNPDTRFLSGSLTEALTFMEKNPTIGVMGGKLIYPDGSVQVNYRRFPTVPAVIARGLYMEKWIHLPRFYQHYLMVDEHFESPTIVDWVLGAFMLLPRACFESVGGMDERFFLYYEDVDLCYRLRQRGLCTYYYPKIEVVHHHCRTSATNPLSAHWRWHVQSICRYFWKHRYLIHPQEMSLAPSP